MKIFSGLNLIPSLICNNPVRLNLRLVEGRHEIRVLDGRLAEIGMCLPHLTEHEVAINDDCEIVISTLIHIDFDFNFIELGFGIFF